MMMSTPKKAPAYWKNAKTFLCQKDKVLKAIINKANPEQFLSSKQDPFYTFCKIIVGQQISVHAADAIFARFERLFHKQITATSFLMLNEHDILKTGFSKSKVRYLNNIAKAIEEGFLEEYHGLSSVKDKEKKLMRIVGIGQWSADMFLIFHDLEPNILPLGDVGLINAIKKHYQVQSNEDILKVCEQWQPFSTVATWFLWSDIDDEIVAY